MKLLVLLFVVLALVSVVESVRVGKAPKTHQVGLFDERPALPKRPKNPLNPIDVGFIAYVNQLTNQSIGDAYGTKIVSGAIFDRDSKMVLVHSPNIANDIEPECVHLHASLSDKGAFQTMMKTGLVRFDNNDYKVSSSTEFGKIINGEMTGGIFLSAALTKTAVLVSVGKGSPASVTNATLKMAEKFYMMNR